MSATECNLSFILMLMYRDPQTWNGAQTVRNYISDRIEMAINDIMSDPQIVSELKAAHIDYLGVT